MRNAFKDRLVQYLVCASVLATAGCGLTTTGSSSAGDSNLQHPDYSASPTPDPSAAGQGHTARGQVTVTLIGHHYAAADPITATVNNGLSTSIWAADHQTSCSVLTVEMQQGNQWVPIAGCRSMIATRMVSFAAGSQTTVRLLGAGADPQNVWPAGTYRARFTYRGSESTAAGPMGTVYSAQFTIG